MSARRRVALISGAGRGIGAATARELARRGHHVIVNYKSDHASATAVVESIKAAGGSAQSARADVCDSAQVAELVQHVLKEHEAIDTLVCNANTAPAPLGPLPTLTWDALIGKIDGELSGMFFLTQHVLEAMRPARAGRIIYVSSTAGSSVGGSIAHSTAKAALNMFGRHVAADAARYGITVNTVAPGPVNTAATADLLTDEFRQFLCDHSVIGRRLEPDDLGRLIGLMADDGFSVAVGTVLEVDGGLGMLAQPLPSLMDDQDPHGSATR